MPVSERNVPFQRGRRPPRSRGPDRLVSLCLLSHLLLLGACRPGPPPGPVSLRLIDLFETAAEGSRPKVQPAIAWHFASPAEAGEAGATGGWEAGPGIAELRLEQGLLAGRTTSGESVLRARAAGQPAEPDELHSVVVRMRASAGKHLYVRFLPTDDADLEQVAAQPTDLVWGVAGLKSPLLADGELHTYVLTSPLPVRSEQIRTVLLRPSDAAEAKFAVESLEVVLRKEHLAAIPSGPAWQGLEEIYRETLVSHAPESLRFAVRLPPRPWLELAVGTLEPRPVRFEVRLAAPGRSPETVYSRTVDSPGRWQEERVDLRSFGGERATLELAVSGERPGAVGFWGSPAIRGGMPPDEGDRPRGLILIVADTLRADRLDLYGNPLPTAPTLRRLGEEGVTFADCQAEATWTKTAVPSILTSLYPDTHRVLEFHDRLSPVAVTLAESFRQAGYSTLSLSSVLFTGRMSNLHQGFEVLHEVGSVKVQPVSKTSGPYVDRLLGWLEGHRETPFFVLLHLFDPHYPYRPQPPYDTLWNHPDDAEEQPRRLAQVRGHITDPLMRAINMPTDGEVRAAGLEPDEFMRPWRGWYDASLRALDDNLGRLVAGLEKLGLSQDVVIAFTSDHGEEFFDHGRSFHGQSVFGELTHVPLVLWRGGKLGPRRVEETVQTVDVMPTLLDLAGIEPPPTVDGRSLAPLFVAGREGEWPRVPRPAVSVKHRATNQLGPPPRDVQAYAMILDGWKLIETRGEPSAAPRYQLFKHPEDAADREDFADREPVVVERLARVLDGWRSRRAQRALASEADLAARLSGPELDRLRALGYVE